MLGTGFLIGLSTVITAGHCLFDRDTGEFASSVEVVPAYQGGADNGGDVLNLGQVSDNTDVAPLWKQGGTDAEEAKINDYGVIVLDTPMPEWVGWFLYGDFDDADVSDALVNIFGYPSDRDSGEHLYGDTQRLPADGVRTRRLLYEIDTHEGQSGSPLFIKQGEERVVIGIHNYGRGSFNQATRITGEVADRLDAWCELAGD